MMQFWRRFTDWICRLYGGLPIETPHPSDARAAFRREASLAESRLLAAWTAWAAIPVGQPDDAEWMALLGAKLALLGIETMALQRELQLARLSTETQDILRAFTSTDAAVALTPAQVRAAHLDLEEHGCALLDCRQHAEQVLRALAEPLQRRAALVVRGGRWRLTLMGAAISSASDDAMMRLHGGGGQ